ncbi:MAG: sugar phosphate isomerase/epimerase family protein [Promethearchaeota archaeon]
MKVALNTYSIRNEWDKLGTLDHAKKALMAMCKDMNIDSIEFLDRHFDKDNLIEDVKLFRKNDIEIFAIGPHVKLLVKEKERKKEIDDGKMWLNIAHGAGIKLVRFQVGDGPMPRAFRPMDDFDDEDWSDYNDQMEEAIRQTEPVIIPLIEEAEKLDTTIAIETHHSYSSNYVYMKMIEEKFKSKNLGWIFDIGNFETEEMRWKALDVIKKNTKYIHAKAYDFNENGLEKTLNFPKAAKILHDAGFNGNWSIEFEGRMNGILGAFKTNELCRYSIAKAEGKEYSMKLDFPAGSELLNKYSSI